MSQKVADAQRDGERADKEELANPAVAGAAVLVRTVTDFVTHDGGPSGSRRSSTECSSW